MLAQFALGKTPEPVWADEEAKGPFTELINFSGCEGYIGPVVAAKLAKDFADYQQRAEEYAANQGEPDHGSEDWSGDEWLEVYNDWRRAFEMAADGGAVIFG
jgi:hypothetical protein